MADLRTATEADVPAIVALWSDYGGPTRTPPDGASLSRLLRFDAEALIVAEVEADLVGPVMVGYDGWRCHIYRLAVADDHRRAGLGTALLGAALARARQLGVARVDAMVDSTNFTGTRFWESSGFELDSVERRWSLLQQTPTGAT